MAIAMRTTRPRPAESIVAVRAKSSKRVGCRLTPVDKQRAGALAALVQQYCLADDAASAASRLVCFMHLLGSPSNAVAVAYEHVQTPELGHGDLSLAVLLKLACGRPDRCTRAVVHDRRRAILSKGEH